MCTAITFKTESSYFGRNLDLGSSLGEEIITTPRQYPFSFRHLAPVDKHEAIIGMGIILNNYPLYFDAVNESGLAMAGLNFPFSYQDFDIKDGKDNIASFEIIQYTLSKARNIEEAKSLLKNISITNEAFSETIESATLHWMLADKDQSIVIETTKSGIHIYDNPVGVLTNEPDFEKQLFNLNNYQNISPKDPENCFIPGYGMPIFCKGLGGVGLPGDMSSMSRFVKTSFIRANALKPKDEKKSVSQFMHILESVFQVRGSVIYGKNEYEETVYSSCMNQDKGLYYYKTYDNSRIVCIDMHKDDIDQNKLITHPLELKEDIKAGN